MQQKKWIFFMLMLIFVAFLSFCKKEKTTAEEASPYLNHNDTVKYVGKEVCRSCHENVYSTFIHTGMGMSFDHANRKKSAAIFEEHFAVYDSVSNFYYSPYWNGDSLMVMEYRLAGTDTIHKRTERIAYIIGSGQHTNSHMIDINGYIYQAPITFYTQSKRWDLAPGFEGGFNSRFGRVIQMECMSCHNAVSELEIGSENKFTHVPQGIDCERCHGPGELHVKSKLAGNRVDTSKNIDYTIVNPANLSVDLQNNLCQRCHLQGVAVLKEGKDFLDFKPGMKLSDVMNVFLPQYQQQDKFIMASHVERLRLSPCFQMSELSCVTCHNPHVSVKVEQKEHFNNTCKGCHTGIEMTPVHVDIKKDMGELNCITCHMPKSGAIDIPHVSITDHYIHTPGKAEFPTFTGGEIPSGHNFIGLKNMTTDDPDALLMAQGYIRFYEGFTSSPVFLDSAMYYLNKSNAGKKEKFNSLVHIHYLRNDLRRIIELANEMDIKEINDAHTLFRIGDSYMIAGQNARAEQYLKRAVERQPLNLDFLNKLGSVYFLQGKLNDAKAIFEKVVSENPKYVLGLSNLGIIYINLGNTEKGRQLLERAIQLDPDYETAYYNLAEYYLKRADRVKARSILQQLLIHQPQNARAKELLTSIKNI